MKVSVSLPDEDVEFLDDYAASQGIPSRSAALHKAVRLLRASELGPAYEAAWAEWSQGDDEQLWEATASDGLR
jgi:Arc/MetJ-type ribon-helix-helix transcriptional regulator